LIEVLVLEISKDILGIFEIEKGMNERIHDILSMKNFEFIKFFY
jgi:hypothetical protein